MTVNCCSMLFVLELTSLIACSSVLSRLVIVLPCTLLCSASLRISSATTANPFPASPACAASMAAFMARRFVRLAMFCMTFDASSKPVDSFRILSAVATAPCTFCCPSSDAEPRLFTAIIFFSRICVTL